MTVPIKKEYVFVKRGQDLERWVGHTLYQVFEDVRGEDGKPQRGPATSIIAVLDPRGFTMMADFSQMEPAKQSDWDAAVKALAKEKEQDNKTGINQFTALYKGEGFTGAQKNFYDQ